MAKDPKSQSSVSRRYAVAATPFVIAAVALYNWVISPHVGYLHAMQRLEPVMGRMAETVDTVAGSLDEKLAKMRALRGELRQVEEGLFRPEESKSFFHDLQTLVETTGCVMTEAAFTQGRDDKRSEDPNAVAIVEAAHADMTVAGSYEEIVSLLQALQQVRRKTWVDSCHMTLADPRSGRLECRLSLTIYILMQPGELPQ